MNNDISGSSTIENRRSIRFDTHEELRVNLMGVSADVENLSLGGMKVRSQQPLPRHSSLQDPIFHFDKQAIPVNVRLTLRWQVIKNKRCEAGIRFEWSEGDRAGIMPVLALFLS